MAEFKTLNGYAVKDEKARQELERRLIYPSGDQTGVEDYTNIQYTLNTYGVATLGPGHFYLTRPLNIRASQVLKGSGVKSTTLHTTTNFLERFTSENGSLDYITVSDMTVLGNAGFNGIDIRKAENAEAEETGGRYSTFRNLHMYGFSTCLLLSGAWCVDVDKCRFEATIQCVKQEGSCNNINYTNCIFLGEQDQTRGIVIDATGGAQNCGVTINNCDFERHIEAIRAYCCVGLTVKDIYCEGIQRVFHLDTCPNFNMTGGYVTFPTDKLGNVVKSNSLSPYAACTLNIEKVYVRMNTETNTPLLTLNKECPLYMRNMSVVNDGTGKIYTSHLDINTQYDYSGCGETFYISSQVLDSGTLASIKFDIPPTNSTREHYKVIGFDVIPESNGTTTSASQFVFIMKNTNTYVQPVASDTSFAAGVPISGGWFADMGIHRFINHHAEYYISGNIASSLGKFRVRLKLARGEFIQYE